MEMPKEINGIRIPDSALAKAATTVAIEVQERTMFNHGLRSYLFGALAAQTIWKKIDLEMAYVASVMHDVGLAPDHFSDTEKFEIDGADFAKAWLLKQNVSEEKVDLVWDAIALHTVLGIPPRKGPEAAIVQMGAGIDVFGFGHEMLTPKQIEAVLDEAPRLGFRKAFEEHLAVYAQAKPQLQMMSFTADIANKHCEGHVCPGFYDLVKLAPFDE